MNTMLKVNLFMTIITIINCTEDFYSYNNDCPERCKITNTSCLITEDNKQFTKTCIHSQGACTQEATDTTVCLTPNEPPTGGTKSWPDYREQFYPTTTTEQPHPLTPDETLHVKIALVAAAVPIVIFIILAPIIHRVRMQRYNRNERESLLNSPDEAVTQPYLPTTQPLERNH